MMMDCIDVFIFHVVRIIMCNQGKNKKTVFAISLSCTSMNHEGECSSIPILYGSQTGTAQDVAEYIAGKIQRQGFRPWLGSFDSFPLEAWPYMSCAIFVVSTTGDGETPDNMRKMWRFLLRRSLPKNSLEHMEYALFGLGDTTYAKYCAAARKLVVRLGQLGANPMIPPGYGDEQASGGIWKALDIWTESLFHGISKLLPLKQSISLGDVQVMQPSTYELRKEDKINQLELASDGIDQFYKNFAPSEVSISEKECYVKMLRKMPFEAKVTVNRRMTCVTHNQDVRHIELDISSFGSEARYNAGDIAVIHPENEAKSVQSFANVLSLNLSDIWKISISKDARGLEKNQNHTPLNSKLDQVLKKYMPSTVSLDLPNMCTTSEILTKYLDILGTPRRSFFEKLALFASNSEEKEKLLELSSTDGADLLYEYCTREHRTYLEVFIDFPSCKPPLEYLLEMIPKLRPRSYSIASNFLTNPGSLHVCAAIVKYKTFFRREKIGVCSSYFHNLSVNDKVYVWIRKGSFKLPRNNKIPLILIGPGTGIAPMRSIIQNRNYERSQHPNSNPTEVLFFGCRHEAKDFHYKTEFSDLANNNKLILFTAFSRDAPDLNGGKIYVQHRIKEVGNLVYDLIVRDSAYVFVSGSAKRMPEDVRKAIKHVLITCGQMNDTDAEKYLKNMDREGRYSVEAWS